MTTATLIYPHQLYYQNLARHGSSLVVLVEDPLFFSQYNFHRQKLMLHRASMRRYAADLSGQIRYVEAREIKDSGDVIPVVKRLGVKRVRLLDPSDDWLEQRLLESAARNDVSIEVVEDSNFLTSRTLGGSYAAGRKKLFFTNFYIEQRRRLGILMEPSADGNLTPVGGKWSFDTENRHRLPKNVVPPALPAIEEDEYTREARRYVGQNFPYAQGEDSPLLYPTSYQGAKGWLDDFLKRRLVDFGAYEDAISTLSRSVFHSLLSPSLNVGLITPREVIEAVEKHAVEVPLNSKEGFLRQVIGWREFVRLVYFCRGRRQRTRNFCGNTRPLPSSFYRAATGIDPVDHVIRGVLASGYCHHIERLMILGNFMLLCDFNPDEVYQWFMELFIDAYDWVMVPNVYGMSQYADGGLMITKPYISGSSYILKMSDFKKGSWCSIWDALYWRFIDRHSELISSNPRMRMMISLKNKLGSKLRVHLQVAEAFLAQL